MLLLSPVMSAAATAPGGPGSTARTRSAMASRKRVHHSRETPGKTVSAAVPGDPPATGSGASGLTPPNA